MAPCCRQAALPCSQEWPAQSVKQRCRPGHPPHKACTASPAPTTAPATTPLSFSRSIAASWWPPRPCVWVDPQGNCCRKHPGHQGPQAVPGVAPRGHRPVCGVERVWTGRAGLAPSLSARDGRQCTSCLRASVSPCVKARKGDGHTQRNQRLALAVQSSSVSPGWAQGFV